ncbi:MAG: bi-domain-containing oxidoreductase [Ignavibacteria bacterium]
MKQIIQYQKTGEMSVANLPEPMVRDGWVLVRNEASVISSGTERTSVETASASIVGKARSRPDLVKQVLENMKREGVMATLDKVKSRLDSFKELGYSCAGVVVESGCFEFKAGDRVACAGATANHSEFVLVPMNLCVRIPDGVGFDEAAFTTIGAIAMQGVRQADLRVGENAVVIGLGLIGLITVQILKASGCKVMGIDVSEGNFELAKELGCDVCVASGEDSLKVVESFSNGYGTDAVIITAGTKSNEPVEFAMKYARKRGKVVVVGAVGMSIPRAGFYEKEVEFKISCSYGPGRYDVEYEDLGIDYPYGFVRWTEKRNMEAVLSLIQSSELRMKNLITHRIKIEDGLRAYDIITGKVKERFIGIVIKYGDNVTREQSDKDKDVSREIHESNEKEQELNLGKEQKDNSREIHESHEKEQELNLGKEQKDNSREIHEKELKENSPQITQITTDFKSEEINLGKKIKRVEKVKVGFIGAGNFAQSYLLPPLKGMGVEFVGVCTSEPVNAKSVKDKFGFGFCTTDYKEIVENKDVNTVFIATRHDSHARFVIEALKAGKNVYVEKPLSIQSSELRIMNSLLGDKVTKDKDNSELRVQNEELKEEKFTTEITESTEVISGKELKDNSEFRNQNSELKDKTIEIKDNSEFRIMHSELLLQVGFNRRFSESFRGIKEFFRDVMEPRVITYRVHAGFIPKSHWTQQKEQGGRIIGEGCHFIDTMQFLTGAKPVSVFASELRTENSQYGNQDCVSVVINFSDGSVGNLIYLANGDSSVPKEYCEVYAGGKTAVMNNFNNVEFFANGKKTVKKFDGKKGHKEEVKSFVDALTGKGACEFSFESLCLTTMATFGVMESLKSGQLTIIN